MNYTVVINCAVWLGALAYYFIDAHKWFIGPKITLDTEDLTEEQEVAIREQGLEIPGVTKDRQVEKINMSSGSGSNSDEAKTA